jgi:hypothetical protein
MDSHLLFDLAFNDKASRRGSSLPYRAIFDTDSHHSATLVEPERLHVTKALLAPIAGAAARVSSTTFSPDDRCKELRFYKHVVRAAKKRKNHNRELSSQKNSMSG